MSQSYEDRVTRVVESALYDGGTDNCLDGFDADELRSMALALQHLYKLVRDEWLNQVTRPHEEQPQDS